MQQKVLVTGATGMIGPALVKRLLEEGYSVRALARNHPVPGCLPDGVEFVQGDIIDGDALTRAVNGVKIVFHLAAKLHERNPNSQIYADFQRVNVQATRRLATAAKMAGVGRMIYFSTINVYGPGDLQTICDENSPIKPASIYAETKAEAENVVLFEMPTVVLRLAAVYGPRMRGNYGRLLAALKKGYFVMVGNGRNRRTLVYIDDACEAAVLAAGDAAAVGRVYNVTDGAIHSFQEIVNAICSALGRSYPKIRIPSYPVRQLAGVFENAFKCFGKKSPIGRFTIDKLLEDMAVSGDRLKKELGYQAKIDLIKGWQNCVQRMSI